MLSTTTLNFAAPKGAGLMGNTTVSGTITGSPTTAYVTVAYTNNGIESVSDPILIGDAATANVTPRAAATLQEGVYADTITVKACKDANCTAQFAGSPQTINVRYRIGIAATPAPISAQTVEGLPTASQNLDLSFYAGSAPWTTATSYSSGTGWLNVQSGSGSTLPASTSLAFSAMPVGQYSGTIEVTVTSPSAPVAIRSLPVTYTVRALLLPFSPLPFSVTTTASAAGQTRAVTVTSRDSARQTAWTAALQAPAPWLSLVTTSGDTASGSKLQLALVPAEVEKLRNGPYTANVLFTPSLSGASAVVMPVTLNVDRAQISAVAPYVAGSNRSASVIINGDHLFSNITAVKFGSIPATSWHMDSQLRVVATFPALPAGRYPVNVTLDSETLPTFAELVVMDSLDYANATGNLHGPASVVVQPIFDAERGSCYFVGEDAITAIRRAPSGWVSQVEPLPPPPREPLGPYVTGATLSTDGRELLLFSHADTIVRVDPDTLQEIARVTVGVSSSTTWVNHMAALDDNTVIFQKDDGYWIYEPARQRLRPYMTGIDLYSQPWPSQAGNQFLYSATPFLFPPTTLFTADSRDAKPTPFFTSAYAMRKMVSDRLANRWAILGENSLANDEVVFTNAQGTETGRMSLDRAEDVALTADGSRLIYSSRFGTPGSHLSVVDVASRTELTSIAPLDEGPIHLTPDEREVVICGQQRVRGIALPP